MPATVEWKRDEIFALIQLYQEHPVLWNVKLPSYKNRNEREIAFKKVHFEIHKISETITFAAVKNKVHTLRSQYEKEIKLTRESKKSGAGAGDVHVPKLWCFDLHFLHDNDLRASTSTLNSTDVAV